MDQNKKQEIKVNFPPDFKGGAYANNMMVSHSKNEFVMDYIMLHQPVGVVTSRVITSPSQMKRIISALQDNLKKYEQKFGEIQVDESLKVHNNIQPITTQ